MLIEYKRLAKKASKNSSIDNPRTERRWKFVHICGRRDVIYNTVQNQAKMRPMMTLKGGAGSVRPRRGAVHSSLSGMYSRIGWRTAGGIGVADDVCVRTRGWATGSTEARASGLLDGPTETKKPIPSKATVAPRRIAAFRPRARPRADDDTSWSMDAGAKEVCAFERRPRSTEAAGLLVTSSVDSLSRGARVRLDGRCGLTRYTIHGSRDLARSVCRDMLGSTCRDLEVDAIAVVPVVEV